MTDRIATGEIKIDLDDREAIAGLRKLDAEFDRTMSKIEREHATATVEADIAPLEDSIANAKRELKILAAQSVDVEIDGDDSPLKTKIKEVRAEIKALEAKKAVIEIEVKGEEKVRKVEQAIQDAQQRRIKAVQDAEQRASKENLRRVNQEARVRSSLHQQQLREMRSAETEARRIDKEREGRALRIAQLQKQYAQAVKNVERQQLRRTPLGREAKIEVQLDRNLAKTKMEALKAELNAIGGHPPVGIEVDVDRHDRAKQAIVGLVDKLASLPEAFGSTRLALGPVSASVRTFAVLLASLGPLILSLVGALGALVAVAGSAVAGLGALAIGFTGGLIPAIAGVALVLKPVIGRLQDVNKAQGAYNDAVDKYGKGSKQALAAHHKMSILLGHVDESTIKAFESAGKLGSRWRELTKPSTAVAFKVIGEALKTASRDLPTFASGTNKVFASLGSGLTTLLRGLRTGEARKIIGEMMGNLAKAIPSITNGLGHIATWFGRIGRVASSFLPGIAHDFSSWAKGLADGVKNSEAVKHALDRMMASLKSVGRLFVSSAKFLASFFDAGVESGQNLADSFSDVLDGWTRFNKSVEGKKALREFFQRAIEDTKNFFTTLANIAKALNSFFQAVAPFVSAALAALGYLSAGLKVVGTVINFIKDTFGQLALFGPTAFAAVLATALRALGVLNAVKSAAEAIYNAFKKPIKLAINVAGGALGTAKNALSGLLAFAGKSVKIGASFASGAITKGIALVGTLLSFTGRVVSIGASFAAGVINGAIGIVRRLLAFSGRAVSIGAKFATGVISGAIALVGRLLRFAGRVVSIGARFASGVINSAISAVRTLLSFAGRVVDIAVHVSIPKLPSLKSFIPHASGTKADTAHPALVGEGGGPEILANRKSGAVAVVKQPMFVNLSKDDYVIPTEPKHRARGRSLMAQWAGDMGIPGFKAGKKPPPISAHALAINRSKARKEISKKVIKNPGAYDEINSVNKLKQQEADQRARISVQEARMEEPDTFLLKSGTDADGNDIFTVDQGKINAWVAQLNTLAQMQSDLIATIKALVTAVAKALGAVSRAKKKADDNIATLNKLEAHERGIMSKKGASPNARKAAAARLKVYQQEDNRQQKIRSDAIDSRDDLKSEQQYAGGVGTPGKPGERLDMATIDWQETLADAAAVQGQAEGSIPKPADAAAGAIDPFAAQSLQGAALDAEAALTAIGQGTRTPQAIIADQIANQQSIINTAKGLLGDADPTNDQTAYSAITSAAGSIQSLQGALPNMAAEAQTLGGARSDLFQNFGNNVSGILQSRPFSPVSGTPTGAYPAAGQGNVVNVTNYYQTQPSDPHTWSRNVLFELQAAG
jgi:hypothetical protein